MRRSPGILMIVLAAVGVFVIVGALRGVLPDGLPFTTDTVERSQPVLVESLEDIGEVRAASANLQVIVDLEKDTRFVPSFLKGRRVTMVVPGEVDAGVDLSDLAPDAVTTNADRTQVTVRLPAPRLFPARIDPDGVEVAGQSRGLIDRVGSLFGSDDSFQTDVLRLAEDRLEEAAESDEDLDARARENIRSLVGDLMGRAGFSQVDVVFIEPDPALR